MSRILMVLALVAGGLLLAAPAGAAAPLRVLLTGDSITQGRNLDYTWRYWLYREFQRQGRPVDFVGSRSTPYVDPGYRSARYADPDFDRDHFARAGSTLASQALGIGPEVAVQQPDVVVLGAGINDLLHGDRPAAVDASLRGWIGAVRRAKPDTRIILETVLDTAARRQASDLVSRIHAYDAMMRATARALSSDDSPITIANTTQGWSPANVTLSYDGIHPAPTGETLIAARVAQAFAAVGLLGPSSIFHTVAWKRVAPVSVRFAGRRALVSWDHQAVTGGVVRWHRLGRAWQQTGRSPGHRVVGVVPGATYEFRVRLTRYRMTGRWGPILRVRARSGPAAPAAVTISPTTIRWSAVPGARAYTIQIRYRGRHHWVTRHARGSAIHASKAAGARVRAESQAGHSGWVSGRRVAG